jgi:hypothetical protein
LQRHDAFEDVGIRLRCSSVERGRRDGSRRFVGEVDAMRVWISSGGSYAASSTASASAGDSGTKWEFALRASVGSTRGTTRALGDPVSRNFVNPPGTPFLSQL